MTEDVIAEPTQAPQSMPMDTTIDPLAGVAGVLRTDTEARKPSNSFGLPGLSQKDVSMAASFAPITPAFYNSNGNIDLYDQYQQLAPYEEEFKEDVSLWEETKAVFQTENSIFSNLAEDENYSSKYKIGYDPLESPEVRRNPELARMVLGSNNPEETTAIVNNYNRESGNRAMVDDMGIMKQFGLTGLAMALDPPMVAAMLYTGGTALIARIGARGTAALWAGTSGAAESLAEIMKHDSQMMRTTSESAMNIFFATTLTGAFGAVIGAHTAKKFAKEAFSDSFIGPIQPIKGSLDEADMMERVADYTTFTEMKEAFGTGGRIVDPDLEDMSLEDIVGDNVAVREIESTDPNNTTSYDLC